MADACGLHGEFFSALNIPFPGRNKRFKHFYGSSPSRYVIGKRVTHAKRLLRFSDYSLDEIARESGFYDASYFNKQFLKAEGIPASEYRKKWTT